ncbi:hypothetical protein GCM10010405_27150 [Streptomyces macrosporus]|uniref:Uncharacterized protein n=1 Tax=Streptomyces macrosporus TaxID=44032 RepID=A0ABP5X4Y6_9ACTN
MLRPHPDRTRFRRPSTAPASKITGRYEIRTGRVRVIHATAPSWEDADPGPPRTGSGRPAGTDGRRA